MTRIQSSPVRSFSAPLLAIVSMGFLMTTLWSCSSNGDKQAADNTPAASKTTQNNDDPRGLKRTAKALVDNLVAGDYDAATKDFDEKLKQNVTPDKLKNDWTATTTKYGSCRNQGSPSLMNHASQGIDVVVIRCQMERGNVDIDVDYEGGSKVSGLWLRTVQ